MSEENVEIVERLAAAFNRGDTPAFLDALDEDIELEWIQSVPWGDTYRGRAGVERWLDGFPKLFREFRFELVEATTHGDYVIATIWVEGRGAAGGVPTTVPGGAGLFEIKDGKVVRMGGYRERAEALEAAGLSE